MDSNTELSCFSSAESQRGLSLIELLIATTLGLLIIAGLTQIFADVTGNNREMAKANSQIENARFAMRFLRDDIVHSGYWGSFLPEFDDLMYDGVPSDTPTIVPDPCLAFASWPDATTPGHVRSLLGIPVQAYEASPSAACNAVVTDKLANTDLLVVRHAQRCAAGGTNCDVDTTGRLYFQPSNCANEIGSGDKYSLDPNSYILTERDCATAASKYQFVQSLYYVRDFAVTSGDGIPSLVRSEFGLSGGSLGNQTAQVLIQGIERFRVELGVDSLSETGAAVDYSAAIDWQDPAVWEVATNRGDGIPDGAFVHCSVGTPCTVAQLRNVTTVKIYILARANEPTPGYTDTKSYDMGSATGIGPFNDNFKRHVFSTSVRINNVAGRRETP